MEAIKTAENETAKLSLFIDECGDSPRDWDNLGVMVCWHNHYDLGDKHNFDSPADFQEWAKDHKMVILPLYLYDHSGITMSTGPFACPWDSGQVGWIYCEHETILKEYGGHRVGAKRKQRVTELLIGEVDTYDKYLRGEVYGFELETWKDGVVDSCWGFYDIEDIKGHIPDEYATLVDELA